jgi:hypothetical protein
MVVFVHRSMRAVKERGKPSALSDQPSAGGKRIFESLALILTLRAES